MVLFVHFWMSLVSVLFQSIVLLLILSWDTIDSFCWFLVTSNDCSLLLLVGQLLILEVCWNKSGCITNAWFDSRDVFLTVWIKVNGTEAFIYWFSRESDNALMSLTQASMRHIYLMTHLIELFLESQNNLLGK